MLAGAAQPPGDSSAVVAFTPDGKLKEPERGYRKWVYVGTPITPNELNGGEAPFPDFHAVYIDPESYAHYEKTGEFRETIAPGRSLSVAGGRPARPADDFSPYVTKDAPGDGTAFAFPFPSRSRDGDHAGNWLDRL